MYWGGGTITTPQHYSHSLVHANHPSQSAAGLSIRDRLAHGDLHSTTTTNIIPTPISSSLSLSDAPTHTRSLNRPARTCLTSHCTSPRSSAKLSLSLLSFFWPVASRVTLRLDSAPLYSFLSLFALFLSSFNSLFPLTSPALPLADAALFVSMSRSNRFQKQICSVKISITGFVKSS